MGVGEVVVRDPAVAVYAPVGGPGVADEEFVGLVVVPARKMNLQLRAVY